MEKPDPDYAYAPAIAILFTQPSGAAVRGNWRPRLWTKSTGAGSFKGGRAESKARVASSAMAAVYVASLQRANAGWKGKWKGCFLVSRP
jgi:hypothetical protein